MSTSDPAIRDPAFSTAMLRVAAPEATLAAGSVLADRFTIWRFVARGACGEVYEGFDRARSERVALKTLSCAPFADVSALRRLAQELAPAARLAHRRVMRVHEVHEHRPHALGGAPLRFLAMEFIDGETLAARIARGPLAPRAAVRLARQLLEGLGAAHDAGVLHLDFKSQNVMLRAGLFRNEAVITDFGLSRALEAAVPPHAREPHGLGSPGYLSPEQLEGRRVLGAASDLYSFGVVLFEMLTGRLPFPRERAKALMALQLAGPTPLPSQVLPGSTTALDAFVAKCLARHPTYRYADAESALAALDECRVPNAFNPFRFRRPPLSG